MTDSSEILENINRYNQLQLDLGIWKKGCLVAATSTNRTSKKLEKQNACFPISNAQDGN